MADNSLQVVRILRQVIGHELLLGGLGDLLEVGLTVEANVALEYGLTGASCPGHLVSPRRERVKVGRVIQRHLLNWALHFRDY